MFPASRGLHRGPYGTRASSSPRGWCFPGVKESGFRAGSTFCRPSASSKGKNMGCIGISGWRNRLPALSILQGAKPGSVGVLVGPPSAQAAKALKLASPLKLHRSSDFSSCNYTCIHVRPFDPSSGRNRNPPFGGF